MGRTRTCALVATCMAMLAGGAWADVVTVSPSDTGEALINPAMGWVHHHYDNVPSNYGSRLEPSDTVDDFPGLSVAYLRIPWSYLEPREGEFAWDVVDGPAQRWIARGKQVAFRFSCSESWMRYATPEWVRDAGAKGYDFEPGVGVKEGGPFWEPDYDDPVFLEKLEAFLAAASQRYDGDPNVAFLDVGSFGVWGEGHLWSSTQMKYPASTVIRHIDLHLRHFPRTLLAANDDFSFQGPESIDYAREHGLTLRDDSILVQAAPNAYFHTEMAQGFWPSHPVILESEHYGGSRDRGNWGDGSLYLQCVEDYHASYVSIHWWPREFLDENRELVDRINRRLGYRLQLTSASWEDRVRLGDPLAFRLVWRNAGVAPCYPGGFAAVTLLDEAGGIATVATDESLDMRDLPVGPSDAAEQREQTVRMPVPFYLRPGRYTVCVSVGDRQGTPRIALPLAGARPDRRVPIGQLDIEGDYDLAVGEPVRKGTDIVLPTRWTILRATDGEPRPFCHLGEGERIDVHGEPVDGSDLAALRSPGEAPIDIRIVPPGPGEWDVFLGLWDPARLGLPDERLLPNMGDARRRVRVGRLVVQADGAVLLLRGTGAGG